MSTFDNDGDFDDASPPDPNYFPSRTQPRCFTRKDLITFACKLFTPGDSYDSGGPVEPQPTSVILSLRFKGTNEMWQTATQALTFNATTNEWSTQWDSSAALGALHSGSPEGKVSWMIFASGTVQAARQGYFYVVANTANTL